MVGYWAPRSAKPDDLSTKTCIPQLTGVFVSIFGSPVHVWSWTWWILAPNWDFMSIALLGLGIGSFLFHASLRQTLEFADEFSMLGLTWSMLQATLTVRKPRSAARTISASLAACFVAFAAFYIRSPKIIYQVIAFGTGILLVILQS